MKKFIILTSSLLLASPLSYAFSGNFSAVGLAQTHTNDGKMELSVTNSKNAKVAVNTIDARKRTLVSGFYQKTDAKNHSVEMKLNNAKDSEIYLNRAHVKAGMGVVGGWQRSKTGKLKAKITNSNGGKIAVNSLTVD